MKKIAIIVLLLASGVTMAQKKRILSGDFKNLKGITEFNLVFDYTDLKVDKFETEEAFLEDKMKKREEKGTAEDFKKSWFSDREERYEPKFIESFNKRFDGEIKVDKKLSSAKYTVKIQTLWIYPGYNVGVVRQSSKLNAIIKIVEIGNPDNILLSVGYEKVLGKGAAGFDYNSGYRISEAYAKLAKEFAAELKKVNK
ncbi:hypothetical protein FEDK69T_11610 [Flavobacterium enshiense DK69]|uniref:DUF4410 domain-containing protein n=1 Tax=Flavobacterium enshiense DK69 TaxID=1107311 RepID=V6SBD0_9FLAO|nr:hypothetical protein [Flavobacterium enshiense]ESU23754.1 hypothetical protein FEDK69T_11610 [Flavobacterium enshiense DK69]KGO96119.1 hypothetical protein Q767_07605 [Flavobacterium enshiense DK69]